MQQLILHILLAMQHHARRYFALTLDHTKKIARFSLLVLKFPKNRYNKHFQEKLPKLYQDNWLKKLVVSYVQLI